MFIRVPVRASTAGAGDRRAVTRARLGLPLDATAAQIHQRYRLLASQRHPDAGGTVAAMVELQGCLNDAMVEPARTRSLPAAASEPLPRSVVPPSSVATWVPGWHTIAFVVAGVFTWQQGLVEGLTGRP